MRNSEFAKLFITLIDKKSIAGVEKHNGNLHIFDSGLYSYNSCIAQYIKKWDILLVPPRAIWSSKWNTSVNYGNCSPTTTIHLHNLHNAINTNASYTVIQVPHECKSFYNDIEYTMLCGVHTREEAVAYAVSKATDVWEDLVNLWLNRYDIDFYEGRQDCLKVLRSVVSNCKFTNDSSKYNFIEFLKQIYIETPRKSVQLNKYIRSYFEEVKELINRFKDSKLL